MSKYFYRNFQKLFFKIFKIIYIKVRLFEITDLKLFFGEKILKNEDEVRRLSKCAAILKSNFFFKNAILSFDQSAHEVFNNINYIDFLGSGQGAGVLNCYRICALSGVKCVEKIYLNNSKDLEALNFFISVIDADIKKAFANKKIKIPAILDLVKTDKLTFVYTEYVENATPLENCDVADLAMVISKVLEIKKIEFFLYYKDLNHFYELDTYLGAKKICSTKLSNFGVSIAYLDSVQNKISKNARKCISHGDIITFNILNNGIEYYLIDWDRMGYYPWGFDIGYAVSKSLNWNKIEDYHSFFSENPYLSREVNTCNELSLLFFMFVFSFLKVRTDWPGDLQMKLMERIIFLNEMLSD